MILEKTLESPLDYKEMQPVNSKENQSWIFIVRTEAEAKAPILWPPNTKNWLTGIDPDLGKVEGRKRRGWQRMRWLDDIIDSIGMSLSKLLGVGDGQGILVCCSPWSVSPVVLQTARHSWAIELNWTDQSLATEILEHKKIKFDTVSTFPHLFALKWCDQMPWS